MILRGRDHQPLTAAALAATDPALAIAAEGLVALARLSEAVSEGLRDHPDARVRRSAAVVAATAYPLLAALTIPSGRRFPYD